MLRSHCDEDDDATLQLRDQAKVDYKHVTESFRIRKYEPQEIAGSFTGRNTEHADDKQDSVSDSPSEDLPISGMRDNSWSGGGDNSDPSWLTRRNRKKVTFHEHVSVSLHFHEQRFDAILPMRHQQRLLRSFWHLDGQITNWSEMLRTVSIFKRMMLGCPQTLSANPDGVNRQENFISNIPSQELEQVRSREGEAWWWSDLSSLVQDDLDRRPKFVATWYLSPGRFPICLQYKKVKVERSDDFRSFRRRCLFAWQHLLDDQHVEFYLVDGHPPCSPTITAHVIIVQGQMPMMNFVLFHGVSLPALRRTRAVLFQQGATVRDFFQQAQFPEACQQLQARCYLKFAQDQEDHFLEDVQQCDVPVAAYVEGDLRIVREEDSDSSYDGTDGSTTSTECPDTDAASVDENHNDTFDDNVNHSPRHIHSVGSHGMQFGHSKQPSWVSWASEGARHDRSVEVWNSGDLSLNMSTKSKWSTASTCSSVQERDDLSEWICPILRDRDEANSDLVGSQGKCSNRWQALWDSGEGNLDLSGSSGSLQPQFTWMNTHTVIPAHEQKCAWTQHLHAKQPIHAHRSLDGPVANKGGRTDMIRNVYHQTPVDPLLHAPDDVSSFMSGQPIVLNVEGADEYPWIQHQWDDAPAPEEEIDIDFAEAHEAHVEEYIHAVLHEAPDPDRNWRAITFGVEITDLGRREVEFSPWDLNTLLGRIHEAWAEYAARSRLTVYYVFPQPSDIGGERSLVLIVNVESPETLEEESRYILVTERGVPGTVFRNQPYAARVTTGVNARALLAQLHLHRQCYPFTNRVCDVRMAFTSMTEERPYEFEHGANCLVWFGDIPTPIQQAGNHLEEADPFFLQVNSMRDYQGAADPIICHVHGVSPQNRPLGFREVVLRFDQLQNGEWIQQMRKIWPFDHNEARIIFVASATEDSTDQRSAVYHFVAAYGHEDGALVLVEQCIVAVDSATPLQSNARERWAIVLEEVEVGDNVLHTLRSHPFWFQQVRHHNIQSHCRVNGIRIADVGRVWDSGDFLQVRILVWQPLNILDLLMTKPQPELPDSPEYTSFLQIQSTMREAAGKTHQQTDHICNSRPAFDPDSGTSGKIAESCRNTMEDLQNIILDFEQLPWIGFNNDFAVIPHLHPFAQVASETTPIGGGGNIMHVFTDGSAANKTAAWAFVILNEHRADGFSRFEKLGYAGAMLEHDITPHAGNALDAEATAIIAACEYLLSRKWLSSMEIQLHYDATAAGHGAIGLQNIPQNECKVSQRQQAARILMAMLQARVDACTGFHVKAHHGQPWNEMADSLAYAIRKGWQPPIPAKLRSGHLLNHPLAYFAWIEAANHAEIPSLRVLLSNPAPTFDRNCEGIDPTLQSADHSTSVKPRVAALRLATANVRTMDYQGDESTATTKVDAIMQQMLDKDLVIVALQESRDCNARVGSVDTDSIGSYNADVEDEAGAMLRSCVPGIKQSYVDMEVDLLNGDSDHHALCLELHMSFSPRSIDPKVVRKSLYDRNAARINKRKRKIDLASQLPVIPWCDDVNKHWNCLRSSLQAQCQDLFPKVKRQQRQDYFDSATWQSLCDRKDLRQQHRALSRQWAGAWLKACFAAWRNAPDDATSDWRYELHQIRLQDAILLEARRKLDHAFRSAKKKAWKQWVQQKMMQNIEKLNRSKAENLYHVLQPKKAIAKAKGQLMRPLPGLQDADGTWHADRVDVAMAWQVQFSQVENAEPIQFEKLMERSVPDLQPRTIDDLLDIPTLLDVEWALRNMNDVKSPGVDSLGAEVFQSNPMTMARRLYPLFIKGALRGQAITEMAGGWLLALYKGKGSPKNMAMHRGILLEAVAARIFSRAWRIKLVRGLQSVACPMQFGGRAGLSIEALHLHVKMAMQNAARQKQAHAVLFIDIRAAFYSIAKPLLAGTTTDIGKIRHIFDVMKLPAAVWDNFLCNVQDADLVQKATQSPLVAANVASNLDQTWFVVPDGSCTYAPLTGSRPGDPMADVLFALVMARIGTQVNQRAAEQGIPLLQSTPVGEVSNSVTWVDDLAISLQDHSEKIVGKAIQVMTIVQECMLEHGLSLSYGVGKTAIMFTFAGPQATKARQHFEQTYRGAVPVLSEYQGVVSIPTVTHYRHLGGHLTRTGTVLPEIQVRTAHTMMKLHPLRKILMCPDLDLERRRALVKSMGMSVLTLHSGTWWRMTQGEFSAWSAAVHRVFRVLHGRDTAGHIQLHDYYELAQGMGSPMPMELLFLQRLRLLFHILKIGDGHMIAAILFNYEQTAQDSWLHAVIQALRWMQQQLGDELVPEELFALAQRQTWDDFRDASPELHKLLKKAEKAHLLRIQSLLLLRKHAKEQADLMKQMGWTLDDELAPSAEESMKFQCGVCDCEFDTAASLAVHEQRKHGYRAAMRRLTTDGVCRGCAKTFHTRPRLIHHLQHGQTSCWVFHLRKYTPMSCERAREYDEADKAAGTVLHRKGFQDAQKHQMWRWATEEELQPALEVKAEEVSDADPTDEELQEWSQIGLLPAGKGGHDKTERKPGELQLRNVAYDLANLEQKLKEQTSRWKNHATWVPKPLADGRKFMLILYSGHRRAYDIAQYVGWSSDLIPISIDLAIDSEYCNLRDDSFWRALIAARKVSGAHAAPPCETFSLARWVDLVDQPAPRPLRDVAQPWGVDHRTLGEVEQVTIGNLLMVRALFLLIWVYFHGGAFSLEHPAEIENKSQKWTIWDSAFIIQMLTWAGIYKVRFLQGPLGRPFCKPINMLIGRICNMQKILFSKYDCRWKPSETLGGKAAGKWRTSWAKEYPPRLCEAIAEGHVNFYHAAQTAGSEPDPPKLHEYLQALAWQFDPYLEVLQGTEMKNDYDRNAFFADTGGSSQAMFQVSGGSWCALHRQQALPLPQKPGQLPACFPQPYLEKGGLGDVPTRPRGTWD
eukprot:s338_g22.t1